MLSVKVLTYWEQIHQMNNLPDEIYDTVYTDSECSRSEKATVIDLLLCRNVKKANPGPLATQSYVGMWMTSHRRM